MDEEQPKHQRCVVADIPMEWWVEGSSFHCTFVAPRMLRLHPEYESMVLDQCVQTAYQQTMMPVGEVYWTDEDIDDRSPGLSEGQRMTAMAHPLLGAPSLMRVNMEVMV